MAIAAGLGENQKRLEAKSVDYAAMQKYQDDVHDILRGQEAIIKAQDRYLPKYSDETTEEYNFRLQYARFTNLWRDMVEGLSAKPFEREITFTDKKAVTDTYKAFSEDVDGSGQNHTIFAMDFFFNAIGYSLDFIFVDYPEVAEKVDENGNKVVRSQADEQELGLRPYWSRISCRNVYEVQSKIIKGRELIAYIRIFEPAQGDAPNQFREMKMEDNGSVYYEIWQWNDTAKDYQSVKKDAITIGYIPIVPLMTGRRIGRSWQSHPAMKDAADLQITLYKAESNLEVTKVYAAYPMLVGLGVSPDYIGDGENRKPKRLIRGPGITLYAPMTKAGAATDWKFIEPGGSTLTFLQSDVDKIKTDLRELGKQPLTVTSGNLTTITTAVAAGKAKSAVKSWAAGLSDALTMAYWFTALWLNDEANAPDVQVYDEFDEFIEPGQDITALLGMANSGKLSLETLWQEMVRRKVLPVEFDPQEERTKILADVPNVEDRNQPENNPPK